MAGKLKAYLIFSTIISICALVSSKLILTPHEIRALEKFRPLVEDILTRDYQRTDGYLIRWLKAKKLNVKEAVEMLTQSQKWRAKNNIDSILNETFPEFSNIIYTDDGIDYEGRTVFTVSVSSFDMRKIVLAGDQDRYIRFARYSIEKAMSRAEETVLRSNGTLNDSRLVSVSDLIGFSLRKHACLACLSLNAKMAVDFELNYPGVNGLAVYINIFLIAVVVPRSNGKLVITTEEMKALEKFRPLVNDIVTNDYMKTDGYQVRWLRATKLNVNDAVEKFKKSLKWREENRIDSILNETFPEFDMVFGSSGMVDYEGRLVTTLSFAKMDLRKLIVGGKRDRFLRYAVYDIEKETRTALESARLSNGTIMDDRIVSLVDMQGFSLRIHACLACIPFLTSYVTQVEDNYPGSVAHSVYINTHRIALPVVNTLISLSSDETKKTVKIFGSDRLEWTKYLHTIIPPDELTYQFGGTLMN